MKSDATKYNIEIFRGDTYSAKVNITGYTLGENDIIKYAIKKSTKLDEDVIAEHTLTYPFTEVRLTFDHNDTDDLDEGTYYYDMQLIIDGATKGEEGTYKTLVYGNLKIAGDVTD